MAPMSIIQNAMTTGEVGVDVNWKLLLSLVVLDFFRLP